MNAPDPNCPRCKGTGRWVLFQLPEPCECAVDPDILWARRMTLSVEDWKAALFPDDGRTLHAGVRKPV